MGVPFFEGIKVRADLSKNVYFPLVKWHCYPHQRVEDLIISTFLSDGNVVVDVGANIGWITLLCASCVGKSGTVYAFEPSLATYPHLSEVAQQVVNIRPIHAALSNVSGTQSFTDEELLDQSHISTDKRTGSYPVTVLRLDDWIASTRPERIDFLKVDVEGSDLLVLLGALATIQHYLPVVEIEILDESAITRIKDALPCDYRLYRCCLAYPFGFDVPPRKTNNYFAIPEIRLRLLPDFLFRRGFLDEIRT
jgi:FkbM family methyltransferase